MKTSNKILFVVLFASAAASAVLAILNGQPLIAWMITMCMVGYCVWIACHLLDSRFDTVLDGILTLLQVAKVDSLMKLSKLEGMYTDADLVKFGNYLLSEKREQSIENKENIREVHDSDLKNWK